MLTILAWLVFIPAVMWNAIFWSIAFVVFIESKDYGWANRRNLRDSILSLAALMIPGVFLFGWY